MTPVMSGPMASEFWREAANAEERVDIIIYPLEVVVLAC
jgi:hypothetical protein